MTSSSRTTAKLILTIIVIEFISGFTQGFYEPLIPKFGQHLGVDASSLTLFNIIPTALAALVVPAMTRLGDIRGYRRILRLVITVVFAATVIIMLGAAFKSWELVLFGRLANGPIAVWLPLHIALTHAKTSGQTATRAVSAIVAILTAGTVVGTASAGFIYDWLGALPTTLVVVPAAQVMAVILVWAVMPEFVSARARHLDGRGLALLAGAMALAIIGFVEVVEGGAASAIGAGALVAAGAVGLIWYRYEKRIDQPAIDVKVLFSRRLGPLYIAAVAMGAVFYGFLAPIATFLAAIPAVQGFGYGLTASGISVTQTLILLATVIAAVSVPWVVRHFGARIGITVGFGLAVAGFGQWFAFGVGWSSLVAFVALVGLGLGLVSAAIPVVIPLRAPAGSHGIATGLFNSAQTLGGAFGGGLFLSLLAIGRSPAGEVTRAGYNAVWLACTGILLLGLAVVALTLSSNPAETGQAPKRAKRPETISAADAVPSQPPTTKVVP